MEQNSVFAKEVYRTRFEQFYRKYVAGTLDKYNEQRKKDKFSTVCAIVLITFFLLSMISIKFIIFTFLLAFYLLYRNNSKSTTEIGNYDTFLKGRLMSKFLSIFGDFKWNFSHIGQQKRNFKTVEDLQIFPKITSLSFDDHIKGRFSDVGIEILELRGHGFVAILGLMFLYFVIFFIVFIPIVLVTTVIVALTKISPVIYLFEFGLFFIIFISIIIYNILETIKSSSGILIKLDFPKRFKGNTFIMDKKSLLKRAFFKKWNTYEKVVLEDVEFNKKYLVLSNNQIEARYVLTLTFIENLRDLSVAFNAKHQRVEFKNNQMYIFLGTKKDLFKMGSLNEEITYRTFENLFEEMYSVLSIVEQLKLNQKIGL